ncbi:MAG: tRNA (5-methylaminomethyl-2-thiouridine)(34)-methyltransferase MnmD [Planctomycetota bacterium]
MSDPPPSPDAPVFDDRGRLVSPRYDDIYFSAGDGLAETRHVFLQGNHLAERFASIAPGSAFTIGETGFGTGLNFLAAWQLFAQHAPADTRLEFVSVEGSPLDSDTMRRALSPWAELGGSRESLLQQWGPIWRGMHRFRLERGRVRLTLLVGEAAQALSSIDAGVDAWFMDGFAPARNPAMWSEAVFQEVGRLSATGATLATYTAAGFVRRGLETVGFAIDKRPGFGTKRDMTAGRYTQRANRPGTCDQVMVIGASLAGAFVARSLAERGTAVTVVERQTRVDGELPSLAPRIAVLQPKISDIDDPVGHWLREGYAFVERWLSADQELAERAGWHRCGSFQTRPADRSALSLKHMKRLKRFYEQFVGTGLCRWVEPEATESEVGLPLPNGGLLIERAGLLRPAGLCAALLEHPKIQVRDGVAVEALHQGHTTWLVRQSDGAEHEARSVVLANAYEALRLQPAANLRLKPVRGQVTLLDAGTQSGELARLKRAMFYRGYLLPAYRGVQTLGASFVPGDTGVDWRHAEHVAGCENLKYVLRDKSVVGESDRVSAFDTVQGWAALRTTTPNHRCYAKPIGLGLYASLGHGSHGIASAAAAGEHIASLITGGTRARKS